MFRAAVSSSVIALAVVLSVAAGVSAQTPAPAAPAAAAGVAAATPDNAASFLGDWTLGMQGPNGPGTFALSVKADGGKVTANISSDQMPATAITDISKSDASLVLKYSFDYQGMAVPAVVTLTPSGDKVGSQIDFADGAYVMTGTATKNAK